MSARCPSDLALEEFLLERAAQSEDAAAPVESGAAGRAALPSVEARTPDAAPRNSAAAVAQHLEACEHCRERLARMEREAEDFRRFVFPRTIDRIEEAAERRTPRRWFRMLLPVPAVAAAAAAVLLLVRPAGPPDDYVGIKGAGDLGLTVFTQAGNGPARVLADGAPVSANAALRFRARSAAPCRLVIASVDGDGNVSRLDPGGAEGFALSPGGQDLPGGVQLDGKPGPERVFAMCGPTLTPATAIEAVKRTSSGGADAVRRVSVIRGLPEGVTHTTLLMEKTP